MGVNIVTVKVRLGNNLKGPKGFDGIRLLKSACRESLNQAAIAADKKIEKANIPIAIESETSILVTTREGKICWELN